jgi:cyclase
MLMKGMNSRRTYVCFALSFCMVIFFVWAPVTLADQGLTKITENVYSYADVKKGSAAESFGANAGIIIGKDGIVVVDTLTSAKEAKRLIKDIRAISKKPIRYVVDTHDHLDHAFGNSEFAKLGAVVVAHENCRDNLQKNGASTLKNIKDFGIPEKEMAGTEIALPRLTYDSKMTIDLGDQIVELIHLGAGHTNGDTMVYLRDKKILFTGDVLFTNYHPFLAGGDLDSWPKVLDGILSMDVVKIIPGHGPVSTKKDVQDMKAYLAVFDAKAKELCATLKDMKAVYAELMKVIPVRESGEWIVGANLQMRYLKK